MGAVLAAAVLPTVDCGSSNGAATNDCVPAPGSCDAPAPKMSPVDPTLGCLAAPVVVGDICDTSVNRCAPSGGIGPVCAFAPDGGVFVAIMSDNDILTAQGWRFSEPLLSFPNPAAVPPDEIETAADGDECARAQCAAPCAGVAPLSYRFFCSADGGDASDGAGD